MIKAIQIIYYIFFCLTCVYGLYFLFTGFFAFKKIVPKKPKVNYTNKFSILIAARNESMVVGNLVKSILVQNYNKDCFEVNVIANNCTDNTAEIALKSGANVIECTIPVKSKGEVLKWTFDKFKNRKDIDAYVIFDADNIVHPDFLKNMNISLNTGYNVAQGFRDSKNMKDNWLSGSYSLFYFIQNFFLNRSRKAMNLSASINGTGFVVKKDLIDRQGFNTVTLTEDVEFTGICAINGEKIDFVEKAITYDEQPIKFRDSWKQRKRWSVGNLQCFNVYKKQLFKHFFKDKNMSCLDMALSYIAPLVQCVSFALCAFLIIFNYVGIKLNDIFSFMFSQGILFFVLTYGIGVIVSVFVIKFYKKNIMDVISGILLFAVFFLSWIPINFVCLIKKKISWDPIKHDRDVSIEGLLTK